MRLQIFHNLTADGQWIATCDAHPAWRHISTEQAPDGFVPEQAKRDAAESLRAHHAKERPLRALSGWAGAPMSADDTYGRRPEQRKATRRTLMSTVPLARGSRKDCGGIGRQAGFRYCAWCGQKRGVCRCEATS